MNSELILTLVVMTIVLIVGFLAQWIREVRIALELSQTRQVAEALRVEAEGVSAHLAQSVEGKSVDILNAIKENTEISAQALDKANHVNEKIEHLNARLLEQADKIDDKADTDDVVTGKLKRT